MHCLARFLACALLTYTYVALLHRITVFAPTSPCALHRTHSLTHTHTHTHTHTRTHTHIRIYTQLLGNNVAEARKAAGGRFDLPTCRRIATSMLQVGRSRGWGPERGCRRLERLDGPVKTQHMQLQLMRVSTRWLVVGTRPGSASSTAAWGLAVPHTCGRSRAPLPASSCRSVAARRTHTHTRTRHVPLPYFQPIICSLFVHGRPPSPPLAPLPPGPGGGARRGLRAPRRQAGQLRSGAALRRPAYRWARAAAPPPLPNLAQATAQPSAGSRAIVGSVAGVASPRAGATAAAAAAYTPMCRRRALLCPPFQPPCVPVSRSRAWLRLQARGR